jgi:hypothetical protein
MIAHGEALYRDRNYLSNYMLEVIFCDGSELVAEKIIGRNHVIPALHIELANNIV